MEVARNSCSASMARASRCGQVALPKDTGEFLGAEVLAAFVQEDRLERCLRIGNASAGFGQLGEFQRPLDALGIALHQFLFGRAGDFAAGDDVKKNGCGSCLIP